MKTVYQVTWWENGRQWNKHFLSAKKAKDFAFPRGGSFKEIRQSAVGNLTKLK